MAERVEATISEQRPDLTEARLAFERLFVSAVVRCQQHIPARGGLMSRRLPGNSLALRALRSQDTPLGRNNFLKGQAINGPFGIMARLARNMGIVDEEDRLGQSGEGLLLAWSKDTGLSGILEDDHSDSEGHRWLKGLVQATNDHMSRGWWPSRAWAGWQKLAERLRPDRIGRGERKVLRKLLDADPIRRRCLELLCKKHIIEVYRNASGRAVRDRKMLMAILRTLSLGDREEDRVIGLAIRLADAYEKVACHLETAFNCLLWGLPRRGGYANAEEIESDVQLQPVFGSLCRQLPAAAQELQKVIEKIPAFPRIADENLQEPLEVIASQAAACGEPAAKLIETVMARHREVQAAKGKGLWIESGARWVLMPGFGLTDDEPPQARVTYRHPFRVPNAYSFLADLGEGGLEVPDEEA